MKTTGIVLLIVGILGLAAQIIARNLAGLTYDRHYDSYWTMADRAATIDAKEVQLTKFVEALEAGRKEKEFADYNALVFTKPQNSFEANLTALKTLVTRLHEIRNMKPDSFEYQTAIQQITAQEQGEAQALIATFYGCWLHGNHLLVWGWPGGMIGIGLFLAGFLGCIILLTEYC